MQNLKSERSEKEIRLGVVLAFAGVALLALVTWTSISRMVRDAGWVEHTILVLDGIDRLDGQITRRQSVERIYQLNHDTELLSEYRSLSADIRHTVGQLRSLTADNPRQQGQLRALSSLLDQTEAVALPDISAQTTSASTRQSPALDGTAPPVAFTMGLSAMRDEEHRLLGVRRRAEQASLRLTYIVLAVLVLVLAAILAGTYLVSRRALESRSRALEESARLNVELEKTNLALEHKRSEAEHANTLKSQFLATMSHELRTPLNAISGFSELLSDQVAGPLNEKQMRFLGHIRDGSKHLLQLINDVLDLSKIEAGDTSLELDILNPAVLIDEVIAEIGSLVREKSIQLKADCDSRLVLQADRRRLKQILYNLLSNAIKFTPAGGNIRVKMAPDGEFLRFEVSDTGPGIPAQDQQIIFDEFRQAAPPIGGIREGTGLGLAITKKLVERHGGRIEVESQPGAGSTFRFWLPSGVPAPTPGEFSLVSEAAGPMRWSNEKGPLILVVDDELNARELIRNVLEGAGYRVATADSGTGAVQAARELRPDLITLDLLMPGGNGFGTLYELRRLYSDAPPPVVMVSVVDDRATGFALGAADYLIKPVSKSDLLEAVRKHLPVANAGLLVVDDDPAMLELAREAFSESRIRLYLAASGQQGLAILDANPIDAIVLDLLMPEMDGFEFLNFLRSHKRHAHIPVSVLTSKVLSVGERQQLRYGANSIFSKSGDWRPGLVSQIAQSLARTGTERDFPS